MAVSSCKVTKDEVWKCATSKALYGRNCVHPTDIHHYVQKESLLMKPILLGVEGPKYRNLYDNCDSNKDSCITFEESQRATSCVRSCSWLEMFHSIMQCDTP